MKRILLIISSFALLMTSAAAQDYIANRAPLLESRYMELPLGDIKAEGWLQLQLEAQRTGLTGHLDEYYPNVVGKRNAWLGGDGDAWERGPYWIDGLLPLAYLGSCRGLCRERLLHNGCSSRLGCLRTLPQAAVQSDRRLDTQRTAYVYRLRKAHLSLCMRPSYSKASVGTHHA